VVAGTSRDVGYLDGLDTAGGTTDDTVIECVYFEMPWLLFVPRDPFHRVLSGYPADLGEAFRREADQTLAKQACHGVHLVQQTPPCSLLALRYRFVVSRR
jgi:hypothetical protein